MAGRLGGLTHPVRLAVYPGPTAATPCADTQAIVEEVAALSPHLSVDTHDRHAGEVAPGVEHLPAIVVLREVDGTLVDHGVRLVGAPVGYELTSLADAILTVGSGDAGLTADSLARLATLSRPVHLQVFSTPTCVYCPRAVALAHRLALASPLDLRHRLLGDRVPRPHPPPSRHRGAQDRRRRRRRAPRLHNPRPRWSMPS